MKTKFFVFCILLNVITACNNTPGISTTDDSDVTEEKKGKNNSTSINFNGLTSTPKAGQWIVTLYQEDASVRTNLFNGYTFTFNASNSLKATKNGATTDGKWGTGMDSSKKKLYIQIGTTKPLSELTEDWLILEETSTKIVLKHVSGGNGGTDLLNLEVK